MTTPLELKFEALYAFLMQYRDDEETLQLYHVFRALDRIPNHGVKFHNNYRITRRDILTTGIYWDKELTLMQQEKDVQELFYDVLLKKKEEKKKIFITLCR